MVGCHCVCPSTVPKLYNMQLILVNTYSDICIYIQGGSYMTGTDLCVNKCKQSRSYLNHLVYTRRNVTEFIFLWKLLYMFRVVSPPIIRSIHNCIYSIWHLSNRYCYLLLLWMSWNWFECDVGIVLKGFGVIPNANKTDQYSCVCS